MSLHGNANKVRPSPWLAKTFITLVVVGGIAVLGHDVLQLHFLNFYEFLSLMTMALVASRLKLKLPGLNGNMSVNLPFILIASTLLSRGEGLSIAAASTLVQCLPKKGKKLVPAQVLFNVSTMAIAAILGTLVYTAGSQFGVGLLFGSLPLVIAAAMFFLGNTVLVATVISLTEGEKIFRVWSNVFQLSFPLLRRQCGYHFYGYHGQPSPGLADSAAGLTCDVRHLSLLPALLRTNSSDGAWLGICGS
jgi:MASE9 protein